MQYKLAGTLESGKMTEALSSLPFEKGGNEGGNAFFVTVSAQGNFLIYQNRIELSSLLQLSAQQENSEWLWHGDYATFDIEFASVTAE